MKILIKSISFLRIFYNLVCPQEDSNLCLQIRNLLSYPLNDGGIYYNLKVARNLGFFNKNIFLTNFGGGGETRTHKSLAGCRFSRAVEYHYPTPPSLLLKYLLNLFKCLGFEDPISSKYLTISSSRLKNILNFVFCVG